MRTIVILLAAALVLSACGGDDEPTGGSTAPATTQQTATQDTTTQTTTEERTTTTTAPAADTAEDLEACLRDAGAELASSPADLRFAAGAAISGDVRTDISARRGNLRVYSLQPSGGDDWRIYVAAPRRGGGAPELADLLRDPGSAVVVAYVEPATGATVRKADACLTG
jgi:thiamine biosynthesis lipoprotein ApbE